MISRTFSLLAACVPTAACPAQAQPARINSGGRMTVLSLLLRPRQPPPAFLSASVSEVASTSLLVRAVLSARGYMWCGVFSVGSSYSLTALLHQGHAAFTAAGTNASSMSLSGLDALTTYQLACVTQAPAGTFMSLQGARVFEVTTPCCRRLTIDSGSAVFALGKTAVSAVSLMLDAAPTGTTLSVSLYASNSTHRHLPLFFPASWSVGDQQAAAAGRSVTLLASITAGLRGLAAGKYTVHASLLPSQTQLLYNLSAHTSFRLFATDTPLPVPVVSRAQFTSEGSAILVSFNVPTDRAVGPNAFKCSVLFNFSGSQAAACLWLNDAVVRVVPRASAVMVVGSVVTLLPSVIRSACLTGSSPNACLTRAYSPMQSALLAAPESLPIPVVSIGAPNVFSRSSVAACQAPFTIDLGASSGAGGRDWSSASAIQVDALHSSPALLQRLRYVLLHNVSLYGASTIPASLLEPGARYNFFVRLCNFLGGCGVSTHTVDVTGGLTQPQVSIAGPAARLQTANQSLYLAADAVAPPCLAASQIAFEFAWSLAETASGLILAVKSASGDSSVLQLPAYALSSVSASTAFTVTVQARIAAIDGIATNVDTFSFASVSARVVLVPGTLVVSLGSPTQFLRMGEVLRLAAQVRETDLPVAEASYSYVWSCTALAPAESDQCSAFLLPRKARFFLLPTLTFSALNKASAVGSVSQVTVTATSYTKAGLRLRSAAASTLVTVLSRLSPVVSIASSLSPLVFNPSDQVRLTGLVTVNATSSSSREGLASWTSSLRPAALLQSQALVPLNSSAPALPFSVYLLLAAGALPPGTATTFTLTFQLAAGMSASNSITVISNAPPAGGSFFVLPASGTELQTLYAMAATRWADPDLPLSFAFSLASNGSSVGSILVTTQSQSGTATSSLPRGFGPAHLFSLVAHVYDCYGSAATASTSVVVQPTATAEDAYAQLVLRVQRMAVVLPSTSNGSSGSSRAVALIVRNTVGVVSSILIRLNQSISVSQLARRTAMRTLMLRGVDYLVVSEPATTLSVASWAATLAAAGYHAPIAAGTDVTSDLSPAAAGAMLATGGAIAAAGLGLGAPSELLRPLLSCIDSASRAASARFRRQLSTASSSLDALPLLQQFAQSTLQGMVPGQPPFSHTLVLYRLQCCYVGSFLSGSGSACNAAGTSDNDSVAVLAPGVSSPFPLSLISFSASGAPAIHSRVLQLYLGSQPCSDASCALLVTLQHTKPVAFPEDPRTDSFTQRCLFDEVAEYTYLCPWLRETIRVQCSGIEEVVTTYCSRWATLPSCQVGGGWRPDAPPAPPSAASAGGSGAMSCSVLRFTASYTSCRCSLPPLIVPLQVAVLVANVTSRQRDLTVPYLTSKFMQPVRSGFGGSFVGAGGLVLLAWLLYGWRLDSVRESKKKKKQKRKSKENGNRVQQSSAESSPREGTVAVGPRGRIRNLRNSTLPSSSPSPSPGKASRPCLSAKVAPLDTSSSKPYADRFIHTTSGAGPAVPLRLVDRCLPPLLRQAPDKAASLLHDVLAALQAHHPWLALASSPVEVPQTLRLLPRLCQLVAALSALAAPLLLLDRDDGSCERMVDQASCLGPASGLQPLATLSRCVWVPGRVMGVCRLRPFLKSFPVLVGLAALAALVAVSVGELVEWLVLHVLSRPYVEEPASKPPPAAAAAASPGGSTRMQGFTPQSGRPPLPLRSPSPGLASSPISGLPSAHRLPLDVQETAGTPEAALRARVLRALEVGEMLAGHRQELDRAKREARAKRSRRSVVPLDAVVGGEDGVWLRALEASLLGQLRAMQARALSEDGAPEDLDALERALDGLCAAWGVDWVQAQGPGNAQSQEQEPMIEAGRGKRLLALLRDVRFAVHRVLEDWTARAPSGDWAASLSRDLLFLALVQDLPTCCRAVALHAHGEAPGGSLLLHAVAPRAAQPPWASWLLPLLAQSLIRPKGRANTLGAGSSSSVTPALKLACFCATCLPVAVGLVFCMWFGAALEDKVVALWLASASLAALLHGAAGAAQVLLSHVLLPCSLLPHLRQSRATLLARLRVHNAGGAQQPALGLRPSTPTLLRRGADAEFDAGKYLSVASRLALVLVGSGPTRCEVADFVLRLPPSPWPSWHVSTSAPRGSVIMRAATALLVSMPKAAQQLALVVLLALWLLCVGSGSAGATGCGFALVVFMCFSSGALLLWRRGGLLLDPTTWYHGPSLVASESSPLLPSITSSASPAASSVDLRGAEPTKVPEQEREPSPRQALLSFGVGGAPWSFLRLRLRRQVQPESADVLEDQGVQAIEMQAAEEEEARGGGYTESYAGDVVIVATAQASATAELDNAELQGLRALSAWIGEHCDITPRSALANAQLLYLEKGCASARALGRRLARNPAYLLEAGIDADDADEIADAIRRVTGGEGVAGGIERDG